MSFCGQKVIILTAKYILHICEYGKETFRKFLEL